MSWKDTVRTIVSNVNSIAAKQTLATQPLVTNKPSDTAKCRIGNYAQNTVVSAMRGKRHRLTVKVPKHDKLKWRKGQQVTVPAVKTETPVGPITVPPQTLTVTVVNTDGSAIASTGTPKEAAQDVATSNTTPLPVTPAVKKANILPAVAGAVYLLK